MSSVISSTKPTSPVFDEVFLRRLEQLRIASRRIRAGQDAGARRSTTHGASVEFADFRDYSPGDDPRRLDWAAYARFDRLFLRLYHDDQNATAHLILDVSGSMDAGQGTAHKLTWATQLTAALGYLALADLDRVRVAAVAGTVVARSQSIVGGARSARRLFAFLERCVVAPAPTDLDAALAAYRRGDIRPGPVIIVSDLLCDGAGVAGMRRLRAAGFDVSVVHVLAPEEIDPAATPDGLQGDLRLIDRETGLTRDMTIDEALLDRYRAGVRSWRDEIRDGCHSAGIVYVPVSTADSLEHVVLGELRRERVVS